MPTFPVIDPPVIDGTHFFTLEEAAALEYGATAPTEEMLETHREIVEQLIEHETGCAFIPRIDTFSIPGRVLWPVRLRRSMIRDIIEITINDTVLSGSQLAELSVEGRWLVGSRYPGYVPLVGQPDLTVTYTHGWDSPPARIKQAALLLLRTWIVEKPVDSRAIQMATQEGSINLATPGLRGSITGIPEVDEAINEFSRKTYLT